MAAFNSAHGADCATSVNVKYKKGTANNLTITVDLTQIMSDLAAHNGDKDSKTEPQDGEEKSKVDEKKDAAKAAVGC